MRKSTLFVGCGIATMVAGAALAGQPAISANPSGQAINVGSGMERPAGDLYDNGPWDGINGYANEQAVFGGLLDDFTVPAGGWDIGGADSLFIWNDGAVGEGSDMIVDFFADDGNCTPGTVAVATTVNRVYTEVDAGMGQAFGRQIVAVSITFDTIHLDPGHYWMEFTMVGIGGSGFTLTAAQKDCACWVNYPDFGGRLPGIDIFGVDSDVVFGLSGPPVPACLTMTVSPLVAGDFATWDVSGATPGSRVAVVNGFEAGSTVITDESAFCVTFGIAGITTNSLVGSAIADGGGLVSIVRHVLKNLSGITVLTQAAQNGTCGGDDCVSDVDTQIIG